jgi:hypothetical protein
LPQAIGQAHGQSVKCELADLLYVVKVTGPRGTTERAVLLQGKMSQKSNQLPRGGSTKVERLLLEHHDWTVPVRVYAAFTATPMTHVGDFTLLTVPAKGFEPFARYLLIADNDRAPRFPSWTVEPYVTGWPLAPEAYYVQGHTNVTLVEATVLMTDHDTKSMGQMLGDVPMAVERARVMTAPRS